MEPARRSGPSRTPYLKESVERRLEVPRAFLEEHYPNNADLRAGLAKGGFAAKHLEALRAALDPAVEADDAQAKAFQGAGEASEHLKEAMPAAETAYDEVYRRAKAATRTDPALKEALGLRAKERSRVKRLAQMRTFLDAADGRRADLDGYGTTDAHFASARATVASAQDLSDEWVRLDKEGQDATRLRDRAMGPLDRAMRDTQERGKTGAPERPDLLELLGLPPE